MSSDLKIIYPDTPENKAKLDELFKQGKLVTHLDYPDGSKLENEKPSDKEEGEK